MSDKNCMNCGRYKTKCQVYCGHGEVLENWQPIEQEYGYCKHVDKRDTEEPCCRCNMAFLNPIYKCEWEPIEPEPSAKHDTGINSESENLKIYKKAIETFGQRSQINVAIEEMSELTKELCKLNRECDNKTEILEEIADVYIMMHQLTLIFDNGVEAGVIKNIDAKTKRLEKMMEEDQ